jgi:hypothetical protein
VVGVLLVFKKLAHLRLATVEYSGVFTLSGETSPKRGLDKASLYLWSFVLTGSKVFYRISNAVVALYFPNEYVAITSYSPQTSERPRLVDLGAELKATIGIASIGASVKLPITRSPPVEANQFTTEDDCGVRWNFPRLKPDSRFCSTMKGAVGIAAYDSARRKAFKVAVNAEATFGRGTIRRMWEPLRIAGASGDVMVS